MKRLFILAALAVAIAGCASNSCWRQLGTDHPTACR